MLSRVTRLWEFDPIEGVLVLIVLALCLDVLLAVILRYVFQTSLGFYDELARYLFIWMSFLGAVTGVKRHGHFGIALVLDRLPERLRQAVKILNTFGMLLFAGLLVSKGWTMVRLTSRQLSAAMEIPIAYVYAVVPLSGALMILYLVPHLIRQLRGRA